MIPEENRKILESNLDILSRYDIQLANRLRNISLPDDIKFISATDNILTAFSSVLSKSGWLAGTSAPSIRESVITENFSPDNSNVLLPGMGQGIGIKFLLEKLANYQAIFVLEQNLLNIFLAFCLYDFSKEIEKGRLVILTDSDIEQCLKDFFVEHNEYAFPTKAIHWPWISEKKMQEISLIIEQALAYVTRQHSKKMSELQAELARKIDINRANTRNNLYIVSFAYTPEYFRFAKSLSIAADSSGYKTKTYLFDTPRHGTHIALLKQLIEFVPNKLISLAMPKCNMPFELPNNIQTISVISLPSEPVNTEQFDKIGISENEIFVIGTNKDAKLFEQKISANNLHAIEIIVDNITFKPKNTQPVIDVAIFADKYDDNPERYGIRQKSHKKLWQTLYDMISKKAIEFSVDTIEQFVQDACKTSGVGLHSEELFESFVSIVKQRLAPSVIASTIVGKIMHSDIKAKIFGTGWKENTNNVPSEPTKLNEIFESAKIVFVIESGTNWREIALDAICAGKPVIIKNLTNDRLTAIKEINDAMISLDANTNIITQIKSLINDYEKIRQSARKTSEFIALHYNFEQLLNLFADNVR